MTEPNLKITALLLWKLLRWIRDFVSFPLGISLDCAEPCNKPHPIPFFWLFLLKPEVQDVNYTVC